MTQGLKVLASQVPASLTKLTRFGGIIYRWPLGLAQKPRGSSNAHNNRVASLEPVIRSLRPGGRWRSPKTARQCKRRPPATGTPRKASNPTTPLCPSPPPPGEINQGAGDEGAGWDAAVEAAPAATPLIGEQQDAAVQRINAYFNGITNLQGNFEQIDSNNKRTAGRFYVQRPGKLRFDYAPPSTLRLVADGHFLAIEDSSLKTIEKYPLRSTPFRLLLGDGVDLARDARIVGVEGDDGFARRYP